MQGQPIAWKPHLNSDFHDLLLHVNKYLESFKIYHFHDTSDSSPLRTPAILNDNIILREDGGNLAAFLYFLQEKHNKHFKRIEHIIKSVAPSFERFELRPDR